ncbi:MAG TPA: hypothetical protein VFH66_04385 [Mycobacteriales bacterium]|nr:hypothetical protein [Mycobacteriales bacterium]
MSALTTHRAETREVAATKWAGETREYDLVKEFVIALVVVALLTAGLAALFSSPDEKQINISRWARADANDFVATAAQELDGTSGTATYGAPYTHDPSAAQKIGPIAPQNWLGVTHPIDTVNDFVVRPLSGVPGDAALTSALSTWRAAGSEQQNKWASAYDDALTKAGGDPSKVTAGDFGPVPVMLQALLRMAQSGGLDGALLSQGNFFQTNYTKPLLFIADGAFLEDQARAQHLGGDQWGMMNETGNYPGQAWLWLYTFWYQVKPFSTSGNADALVWALMMLLTLLFILIPFIPGVRSIPRWIPVHRLIWRDYYRRQAA